MLLGILITSLSLLTLTPNDRKVRFAFLHEVCIFLSA